MDQAQVTASIEALIEQQAKTFATLNAANLTGQSRMRADHLLGRMNSIHTAAEAFLTALGRQAPDISHHLAGHVARETPEARPSSSGASGALPAPAPAPTIDSAAIFAARRAQARAPTPEQAKAITAAPAPAHDIFARRRQQVEAQRTPTPEAA